MAVFWTYYPHNWSCQRAWSPPLTPVSLLRIPKHGIGSRCVFSGTCELSPTKASHRGLSHSDGWLSAGFYSEDKLHEVCFWRAVWGAQKPSNMSALHIILYIFTGFQSSFGNDPRRLVVIEREVFVLSCKFLDSLSSWDLFFRWSMPRGYAACFFFTCRNLHFYIVVVIFETM